MGKGYSKKNWLTSSLEPLKKSSSHQDISCHPPKFNPMVRAIIDDFRIGNRDCVDVWNSRDGQPVLVKYMAVRDKENNYVGTLECVQPMGFAEKHFCK